MLYIIVSPSPFGHCIVLCIFNTFDVVFVYGEYFLLTQGKDKIFFISANRMPNIKIKGFNI
jgi:hypothetical protein